MKKLFIVIAAMLMLTATSAQFKVGGGLTFGTEAAVDEDGEKIGIGITLKGDYAINEEWTISPDFTYYLPSGGDLGDFNLWQLNANAHYYFHDLDNARLYALGGLNYSHWKWEYDGAEFDGWDADDSEIGLNLGIGASMNQFFGELKYDTAFEQLALSVGILF
ncbi:outer membrane beta-barrel protein [Anaerophaga thermohalophila]|jgi:opacity protein-like surface antigen|uniref:outer membrane beta-barrel protein n=1 Tax=Anaerophaga thermohalophila TaxID=177400 RepID=UPI0003089B29|nr:outer membrane beta-barrel protein [Anaerophaga thermohalophila]